MTYTTAGGYAPSRVSLKSALVPLGPRRSQVVRQMGVGLCQPPHKSVRKYAGIS